MEAICSSKTSVDSGLHGVIFQKMVLFIIIAVRTSNPTNVIKLEFSWRLSETRRCGGGLTL
jgi:hypothetical protein